MKDQLLIKVITVKGNVERQKSVQKQMDALSLKFDWVWAYDCDSISSQDLESVNTSKMPLPTISCALKHVQAERDLLDSDKDYLMVLEDDVLIKEGFLDILGYVIGELNSEIPKLIFLGGDGDKVYTPYIFSKGTFLIDAPMSTTECYLTNRPAARLRLDWLSKNLIEKGADHLFQDMDKQLGVLTFRLNKAFATQGSVTGEFDTLLDDSRGKHSKAYLKSRFAFTKFRRFMAAIFKN